MICEDTVGEQSSTTTLRDEANWQAAAARMESLLAQPAIDRKTFIHDVCKMYNQSDLFCLMSYSGQMYVPARGLLDSCA